MSDSKEGFEEEVIKGVEKNVSGYIDSKEYDDDIKKEFASDDKSHQDEIVDAIMKRADEYDESIKNEFKGASFNADFVITNESIDKMLETQTKVEVFRKVVKNALKRVEHDLVDEMKLKDPETYISDITNDMIDNFSKARN